MKNILLSNGYEHCDIIYGPHNVLICEERDGYSEVGAGMLVRGGGRSVCENVFGCRKIAREKEEDFSEIDRQKIEQYGYCGMVG